MDAYTAYCLGLVCGAVGICIAAWICSICDTSSKQIPKHLQSYIDKRINKLEKKLGIKHA